MKDSYGRNIDYLRISVTDRCNLRCIYCMPLEGIELKERNEILRFEEITSIVKTAAALGIKKIRYTGGEPLVMHSIEKLIYETSKIPGIEEIAMTTNGMLLHDMAKDLKKAGLKRVNISLDTLNQEKFKSITRLGNLETVLKGIDRCLELGMNPVKINTVLLKGFNDTEFDDFLRLIKNTPLEIRFIELMPIGEAVKFYEKAKINFKELLDAHPELIEIETPENSTAKMYRIEGSKGKIGSINPISCKFCNGCNKIRLTSTGSIKPCLHSKEEIDVKKYVNNSILLKDALETAILNKPKEHFLEEEKVTRSEKVMYQIGG